MQNVKRKRGPAERSVRCAVELRRVGSGGCWGPGAAAFRAVPNSPCSTVRNSLRQPGAGVSGVFLCDLWHLCTEVEADASAAC